MKKALFKETISYFKKAHDTIFVQFKDGTVHLSEGHIICSMPVEYYETFIIPKIAGFPRYTQDETYTIKDNRIEFSTIDFSSYYNQMEGQIKGTVTPILIDGGKGTLRAITWMEGELKAVLVNDWYYQISKEYTDGNYLCVKENAPVVTGNGDFKFMMLPVSRKCGMDEINYFNMIMKALNTEKTEQAA